MKRLTFGQRVADKVAAFGGSWWFIGLFFLMMITWMIINIEATRYYKFDRYPFILLNLILSCLAAIQAPIIMMSQNRQAEIDRARDKQMLEIAKQILEIIKGDNNNGRMGT
jgi:uncharacterized membrane protein